MTKTRLLYFLVLLFLSTSLFAKDYIFIESLKSKYIPKFQKNELSRLALQIIVKTEKYEILFNEVPTNTLTESEEKNSPKVIAIKFKVTKQERTRNDSYFKFEFYLEDIKTNKKIKRVLRQKVLGRRFLFESRLALYELFYGKDYLKKNKDKIIKEAKEDKTAEMSPIDPLAPNLTEKQDQENLPKNPNIEAQRYQKKISRLKSDIDEKLRKLKKKNKEKTPNKKKSKSSLNSPANISSNNLEEDQDFFKIEKKLEYSIGYEYQSILTTKTISSVDISVKSNYEFIPFYARIYSHLPGDEFNLIFLGLGFKKVLASDSFDIRTPYNIDFGFKKIFNHGYVLQTKLDYSSQDYILLNKASEGLTTTNIKNLKFDLKFEKRFYVFSKMLSFGVNYATSLIPETDQYTQDNLKNSLRSNQYSVTSEYQLLENLYCLFRYEYITYHSDTVSDFELESNNVSLSLTYR